MFNWVRMQYRSLKKDMKLKQPIKVIVPGNSFQFPNKCVCCGKKTNHQETHEFDYEQGLNSRSWKNLDIPYCKKCISHRMGSFPPHKEQPVFILPIAGSILLSLIWTGILFFLGIFFVYLISILVLIFLLSTIILCCTVLFQYQRKKKKMRKTCCDIRRVVFIEKNTFHFWNYLYGMEFARLNGVKPEDP